MSVIGEDQFHSQYVSVQIEVSVADTGWETERNSNSAAGQVANACEQGLVVENQEDLAN